MPYVRCPRCRLATYTAARPPRRECCPRCQAELPAAGRTVERRVPTPLAALPVALWSPAGGTTGRHRVIARVLELARTELRMDLAFLGEIVGGREVLRAVDPPEALPGFAPDDSLPLDDTVCGALLEGRVGNVVRDARHDPEVGELPSVRDAEIGAYVGVPLSPADGQLYMLCCLAREARPTLDAADVRFLRGLGETALAALEQPSG